MTTRNISEVADSFNKKKSISDAANQFLNKETIGPVPEGTEFPTRPNTPLDGAAGWEKDGGQWKKVPSFMQKIQQIGSGAAQGSLEFTASLLNQPSQLGSSLGIDTGVESPVERAYEYWSDKNKAAREEFVGAGGAQLAGSVPAEMLTAAPVFKGAQLVGKGVGAVGKALAGAKIPKTSLGIPGVNATGRAMELMSKGPAAVGKAMPMGTKTISEYGLAGANMAGATGILEGLRFDPERPDEVFKMDQALNPLTLGIGAVAGAGARKLAKYSEASRKLGYAKDTYSPYATAYQLKDQGATRTMQSKMHAIFPNLFGMGKVVNQLRHVSEDTRQFFGKILGSPEIKNHVDAGERAGLQVKAALQRTKLAETRAWDQVPQQQPVKDVQSVKDGIINIIDDIKSNTPLDPKFIKTLERMGNKSNLTTGDVKQIRTKLGDIQQRLMNHDDASLMQETITNLKNTRDGFVNILQTNLDDAGNAALTKATTISASNFELMGIAPVVRKAVKNTVAAQEIADKMISEATSGKKMDPLFKLLSSQGKNDVAKYKVMKALDSNTNPDGTVNLNSFLKSTGDLTQTNKLMGKDTYTAYQGFQKYLEGVEEVANAGWWTQATIAGTAGAGAATSGKVSQAIATGAAASMSALLLIGNHSPLKSLLHGLTKKVPDSTYKAINKAIEKHLSRAGYFYQNGALRHKDEDKD